MRLLILLTTTARADSNGEWNWNSSDDADGGPYGWPDPTTQGATDLGIGTGGSATVTLPFSFPWDGGSTSTIEVYANGVIVPSTGSDPGTRGSGDCIADGSASGSFIAPWWREWDLDSAGAVYVRDFSGGTVITWDGVMGSGDTGTVSFAAVLTPSGEVTFLYEDSDTSVSTSRKGKSGAIGVQTSTGGAEWSCDAISLRTSSYAVWFTPMGVRHWAGDMPLADHVDATFNGAAASAKVGYDVAFVGDIDADGGDDLLVGGPGASGAWLFDGAGTGGSTSSASASVTGGSGDQLGTSVSGGDMDGDGLPDLLIGSPYDDDGGSNAGAMWIVSGANASGALTSSSVDAIITGAKKNDYAGFSVAYLGDADGDGYGDTAVGAWGEDSGGSNAGAAYLVLGASSFSDASLGSATYEMNGSSADDYFGYEVAPLGDANGDGDADFAVGAWGEDSAGTDAGMIYVFVDIGGGTWDEADIQGGAAGGYTGIGLWGGEDLNSDGLGDLLYGASSYASGDGAFGYVKGKTLTADWPSDVVAGDGVIYGASSQKMGLGLAFIDAGDDSTYDVGVGAYGESGSTGAWYVFDGKDVENASGNADDLYRGAIAGPSTTAYFGFSAASGDWDGDGWEDAAVSAYGATGGASASGVVYLFEGAPTYPDADGDGFLDAAHGGMDCDDGDTAVSPGDAEKCNGVDDNCDGDVDEGSSDVDADGTADCVDTEECDGLDNDGDGSIDEGFGDSDGDGVCDGIDAEDCDALDNDGDGLIDEDFGDTDGDGTADCLDAEECDGLDNDGDGVADDGFPDTDKDGRADCVDNESCDGLDNDGDGSVDEGWPDTDEDGKADCVDKEECDGLDNDGDGAVDEGMGDSDKDGFCDDIDSEECDNLDNDGDGKIDEDFLDTDGDGVADCADGEDCDGKDNNGDGRVDEGYTDGDGDTIADCVDVEECDGVDNDGDDRIDEAFPDTDSDGVADCVDVEECDGLDNDGDGEIDPGEPDADADGVADCVDVEECDGVDNDGDGQVDDGFVDEDGDGAADCVDPSSDSGDSGGDPSGGGGCGGCASGGANPAAIFGLLGLAALRRHKSKIPVTKT